MKIKLSKLETNSIYFILRNEYNRRRINNRIVLYVFSSKREAIERLSYNPFVSFNYDLNQNSIE